MKNCIILIIFLLFGGLAEAKDVEITESKKAYPEGKGLIFRLTLKDKHGTQFNLNEPQKFLSKSAIERRQKQGLPIDSTDLPLSSEYLNIISHTGVNIVGKSKWNNTVLVFSKDFKKIEKSTQLPFVNGFIHVWTEPDSLEAKLKRSRPHNTFNKWDTITDSYYGIAEEQIKMLNGMKLHNAGYKGSGVTIAIIDGGFRNVDVIPSFKDINIKGEKDFVYPISKSVYNEIDHGTKVLSDMAMDIPNVFIGTAPDASYWLLRSEDKTAESLVEEDYWAEAAEFADSVGADIINSSLGYDEFDDHSVSHKYKDMDGESTLISHTASMLASKGMILVCSAGNNGMGAWKKIVFPSDAKDVLCVGAVNHSLQNAPFSGVGPTQDGRIKPDVMAMGSPAAVITGRGTIIQDNGTSFAAPILGGLVACLWQALPHMTAKQIMELVRRCGSNARTPDNIFGYGIPDFYKAFMLGKGYDDKTEQK